MRTIATAVAILFVFATPDTSLAQGRRDDDVSAKPFIGSQRLNVDPRSSSLVATSIPRGIATPNEIELFKDGKSASTSSWSAAMLFATSTTESCVLG